MKLPTELQKRTRKRNWEIFYLRGLIAQAGRVNVFFADARVKAAANHFANELNNEIERVKDRQKKDSELNSKKALEKQNEIK